ncbi:MAG TPA: hypothetical protein VFH08_17775 [Chitinophagaceae bacterium]|nr:hypothetical protein [Chitinophagaceae bacterium]
MNKRRPQWNIIESKLEQLHNADTDLLWNDMHSILDKKMPQKKERRRFIAWFLSNKGLLLLTVVFLVTASSLFILSTKESSTYTVEKLRDPSQSNQFIEDDAVNNSGTSKEKIATASGPDQITNHNSSIVTKAKVSATTATRSTVDNAINNNFITKQTIKQSKKSTTKDQFNEPMQRLAKAMANFDTTLVNLTSIYQDFLIATNDNVIQDFPGQQLEPVPNKTTTNNRNNNESGLYAGLVTGVDLSSIHFQSVKTGATMGLIFGYAFNKKWSIESGLLWDTKRVYDNGSHFNPPGYIPTTGVTIIAVNGKNRLYEWPVNMKYTIISGKHSLFTTAGLSSYLMKSENYDYEYVQNNQPGGHNYLSYSNETKDWFSVVNLSIGYTHKLGSNGTLRVEPYLKLPIKNLGVGQMPIMSTGLNIGFTKPLRR